MRPLYAYSHRHFGTVAPDIILNLPDSRVRIFGSCVVVVNWLHSYGNYYTKFCLLIIHSELCKVYREGCLNYETWSLVDERRGNTNKPLRIIQNQKATVSKSSLLDYFLPGCWLVCATTGLTLICQTKKAKNEPSWTVCVLITEVSQQIPMKEEEALSCRSYRCNTCLLCICMSMFMYMKKSWERTSMAVRQKLSVIARAGCWLHRDVQ